MMDATHPENPNAILVVGGGIAGIQAALDAATAGRRVYLLEDGPSIGGRMAQLDKTFPTNDCSLCILSPKLVEVGRHPAITLLTFSDLVALEGEPNDFTAKIRRRPRYVDESRCIGCGLCSEACPVKIPDRYNASLAETKNIRIPFAQAVPKVAVLDAETCLRLKHGGTVCGKCAEACSANAIDFTQTERIEEIRLAGVILAMGTEPFDPKNLPQFGYGRYPDVVTSLEYERILSASGPWGGEIKRRSTGEHPKRVAILQCIGSRQQTHGNRYCSTICCMQATKDAIITREHCPDAEVAVFFMDMRTSGKGFDRYVERAKSEYGVKYIRSRVSGVAQDPASGKLTVECILPDGSRESHLFDLVVLSVGIQPGQAAKDLCRRIGVELDSFGFVATSETAPIATSRPGVMVCGAMAGPKDIPLTVMEASAAAASFAGADGLRPAVAPISPSRASFADEPRIGVFVCHCGINIAGVVDCKGVADYARTLPNVLHAENLIYTCSDDSQGKIRELIKKHDLNRIVVAACSPRTHEALFQTTLKEAGQNPYLFEMANIRDQCSWVHGKEPAAATKKSRELVRLAASRVRTREPLGELTVPIQAGALVIGGGLAGMTAALTLAKLGFRVDLIEKKETLGGGLVDSPYLPSGASTKDFLAGLVSEVTAHPLVTVHLGSNLTAISGYLGNFKSVITTPAGPVEVTHGAAIVATGAGRNNPSCHGYGSDPYVLDHEELSRRLAANHPDLKYLRSVAMLQCVESRDGKRPYCSVSCCPQTLQNAIRLKERFPRMQVHILFRELRCPGTGEALYEKARALGMIFTRFPDQHPPVIAKNGDGFKITVMEENFGGRISFDADLLALTRACVPNADNRALGQLLKVPLDQEGFFLEAHVKLRPVDFSTDGIFLCGLAQGPKGLADIIRQAQAAATRTATLLGRGQMLAEGKTSAINPKKCSGCATCLVSCPYGAITMDEAKKVAMVNQALCKGCGICVAACRCGAADLAGFSSEELACAIVALLAGPEETAEAAS